MAVAPYPLDPTKVHNLHFGVDTRRMHDRDHQDECIPDTVYENACLAAPTLTHKIRVGQFIGGVGYDPGWVRYAEASADLLGGLRSTPLRFVDDLLFGDSALDSLTVEYEARFFSAPGDNAVAFQLPAGRAFPLGDYSGGCVRLDNGLPCADQHWWYYYCEDSHPILRTPARCWPASAGYMGGMSEAAWRQMFSCWYYAPAKARPGGESTGDRLLWDRSCPRHLQPLLWGVLWLNLGLEPAVAEIQ